MSIKQVKVLFTFGILVVPASGGVTRAENAATVFAAAETRLAQADFDGALSGFAEAAKLEPDNTGYREGFMLLRRVIELRGSLEQMADPQEWLSSAKSLRAYYDQHKVFTEALLLDQRVHDRFPSAESAAALADTHLHMQMPSKAVETLSGLSESQATPQTNVLLALAHAKLGQLDQARNLVRRNDPNIEAGPDHFLHLACVQSLAGDQESAAKALTRSFELTPPSRLAAAKEQARTADDLRALTATPAFAGVLETQSKVKESGCSGGTNCGKCPKRVAAKDGEQAPCAKTPETPPCGDSQKH